MRKANRILLGLILSPILGMAMAAPAAAQSGYDGMTREQKQATYDAAMESMHKEIFGETIDGVKVKRSGLFPSAEAMTAAQKQAAYDKMGRDLYFDIFAQGLKELSGSSRTSKPVRSAAPSRSATPQADTSDISRIPPKGDGHKGVKEIRYGSYSTMSGDYLASAEYVYILYKDGMAVKSPNIALVDLGVEKSRRVWPESWYKWRPARKGSGYEYYRLEDGDRWFKPRGGKGAVAPARAGQRFEGVYSHGSTAGSMIGGTVISSSMLKLTKDGRFEHGSSRFMSSGSAVASASCDRTGNNSVASTSPGHPTIKTRPRSGERCGSANIGRYYIDGYSIVFAADNGQVTRKALYMPYGNDDTMMVGNTYYMKAKR